MRHCFTGEMFARTDVPPRLLPPRFVSVTRLEEVVLSFICVATFSSSGKQNEYLLSAHVTKEMNQRCERVSYSKQKHHDTSSLLGVNEIECWRELEESKRNISATFKLISPPQLMNASVLQCIAATTAKLDFPRCSRKPLP